MTTTDALHLFLLGCAIAFRDALVQREPALFETLLETAVRSEHDFQRVAA